MLSFYLSLIDDPDGKSKLEQLYIRYRKMMKKIALNILKEDTLAEDAVHDSFVFIAQNIDRIKETEGARIESYLKRIVKSKAINLYHQESKSLPLDETVISKEKNTDFYKNLDVERILSAIENLPEQYQSILELVVYHQLSIRQIASLLDLRYDNAQKRLKRAKTALLKQLNEEENNESSIATKVV